MTAPTFLCAGISVIAKCGGVEHLVLSRRARLIWFDPEKSRFLNLLNALVVCHDVHVEYRRNYFAHIDAQIGNYVFGTFDIYAILDEIAEAAHTSILGDGGGGRPAYRLTGKRHLVLVPLIGAGRARGDWGVTMMTELTAR